MKKLSEMMCGEKLDSWCRDFLSAQLQFIVEHLLRGYHFSLRSSISVMSLGSIA
jgi:hypothetical protein